MNVLKVVNRVALGDSATELTFGQVQGLYCF